MKRGAWLFICLFLLVGNLVKPSFAKYDTDQWLKKLESHLDRYQKDQRLEERRWKAHMEFHKKENELARKQLEEIDKLLKIVRKDGDGLTDDHEQRSRDSNLGSIKTSLQRVKSDYRSLSYRY